MNMTTVSLLAFTFAGLSGILAVYMWRKSVANYTLLVESATTFDTIRRENARFSESNRRQSEEAKQSSIAATVARSDADVARRTLADNLQKMQNLELESRNIKDRLIHERHQFIAQLESANGQIEIFSNRANHAQVVADAGLVTDLQVSREQVTALTQNLARAKADLSAMKAAISSELETMHKTKRRNTQLERLYQSMRSLKIMAEERSTNWEYALKDLSAWTLTQRTTVPAERIQSMPIGELVSGALEAIGKTLVEVDHEQQETVQREHQQ